MVYKQCLDNTLVSNLQSDSLSQRGFTPFGTPGRAGVPAVPLPTFWSCARDIVPTGSFIPEGGTHGKEAAHWHHGLGTGLTKKNCGRPLQKLYLSYTKNQKMPDLVAGERKTWPKLLSWIKTVRGVWFDIQELLKGLYPDLMILQCFMGHTGLQRAFQDT